MASVAISGLMPIRLMRVPLKAPRRTPVPMQARQPSAMNKGSPVPKMSTATRPVTAAIAPMERSNPPRIMTTVMPTAATPTIEDWARMFERLSGLRKVSLVASRMIAGSSSAIMKP